MEAKTVFSIASEIFLDNIQIYDDTNVDGLIDSLVKSMVKVEPFNNEIEVKLFRERVKEVVPLLVDLKRFKMEDYVVGKLNENFGRVLFFMCEYKMVLNGNVVEDIVELIEDMVFTTDDEGMFTVETVFMFFEGFSAELLKNKEVRIVIYIYTYIPLTLYPRSYSSETPTFYKNYSAMRNTAA
jgi:hypothetical protein